MMPRTLEGLDHVFFLVRDLEAAGATMQSLGFEVTPRATHGDALGTANRLILLDGHYLELIAVERPAPVAVQLQAELERRGEHLACLVLRVKDAVAACSALQSSGIPATPPRTHERSAGDGATAARFSIVALPEFTGDLRVLLVEHHDVSGPSSVAAPHANGARVLGRIGITISDAERAGAALARLADVLADRLERSLAPVVLELRSGAASLPARLHVLCDASRRVGRGMPPATASNSCEAVGAAPCAPAVHRHALGAVFVFDTAHSDPATRGVSCAS